MRIERHAIDENYLKDMKERFDRTVKGLQNYVLGSRRNPKKLSLLMSEAWAAVAQGCVVEPQATQIPAALQLAAESHVALFAAADPPGPVTARLGGEFVSYASPSDQSSVHVGAWIAGFYFSVMGGDMELIDILCRTPIELVRRSTTRGPEYLYSYMEALQMFGRRESTNIVEVILAAIEATAPERPDVYDPDWALYLHVHQMELLLYAVTRNPKFSEALTNAVKDHKKYWSETRERRRDYHGFISIELTALAALGQNRGLSFDFQSPYLPMHLIRL